jgi:hypothetical protein
MTRLMIIRGPSGSGKSTIAAARLGTRCAFGQRGVTWFEADMYFERNGHYNFDASLLGQAHNWCQEQVRKALQAGHDEVIVSNTCTTSAELQDYLNIAAETGVEVEIVRTPGPWHAETLRERNLHNVPIRSIERMINRYVRHPDESEWTNLNVF